MKVRDAKNSIYNGLCAMEWYRYLRAMWIVCGELADLYGDRAGDLDRTVITATLGLVRSVAVAEDVSEESFRLARDLGARWGRIIDVGEDNVFPGQWNMWMVYGMLSSEIAGDCDPHFAADRVNNALTGRFMERPHTDGQNIRLVKRAAEIDDGSPMGLLLARIQRIVAGVARMPDTIKDPAAVREQLSLR